MNTRFILLLTILVSGCASKIATVKIKPDTMEVVGSQVAGVIYYEPRLVKVRYEFTQLVDKDKGFLGSVDDGKCIQAIQKEEIVTLPDYNSPRAILNSPSPFASTEFGVTLNNGMLVSVTSKSTPQTPQLIEQVSKLAATLSAVAAEGQACNSGAVITKREVVNF